MNMLGISESEGRRKSGSKLLPLDPEWRSR